MAQAGGIGARFMVSLKGRIQQHDMPTLNRPQRPQSRPAAMVRARRPEAPEARLRRLAVLSLEGAERARKAGHERSRQVNAMMADWYSRRLLPLVEASLAL